MSPRSQRHPPPQPAIDPSRFVLSFGHGVRLRRLVLAPGAFYAGVAILPALAALYLGATAYLFFRDDMIAALMARQAQQQYAYEDRIAALRLQIDRIAGRQMLDQDSFDGKLQEIATRQARIETRTAVLASLGDAVVPAATEPAGETIAARKPAPSAVSVRPRPLPMTDAALPIDNAQSSSPDQPARPRPDDSNLRPSADATGPGSKVKALLASLAGTDIPAGLRLRTLSGAIDKIEKVQLATLRRLEGPAVALATKLRSAIAATGLDAARLKLPTGAATAVGGPYVPIRIDARASEFDAQLARTQAAVISLDATRRVLSALPLRKPLAGAIEQTSGFGYRMDPFMGRPALHSGLDLRGDYGAPVRATAAGKVVTAGTSGGYGNLVEIEHANGVSTRYGHLSAILVTEGQTVLPGTVVGRIGSTGRSTGNHLHYEVRIDDDAVDPARFIKAAGMLPQE